MDQQRYRDIISGFDKARVLVVGDIYLDENVNGVVTGISLEAPIPIYEVHERKHNPGAAGNAACNVAALGATTYMIGYVGDDVNADIVRKEFAVRNVDTSSVVVAPGRPTNTYGKLKAGGHNIPEQEVLRTDTPSPTFVDGELEEQIIANIKARAAEVDAIVVVDQVSSVATERVLQTVVECAKEHGLVTVGDSRKRAGALKGFHVVVPNDNEAGIGTGIDVVDEASLHEAGRALLKGCRNALITCGAKGITVFAEDGGTTNVPVTVGSNQVIDVTGAGDTVTAAVTLTLVAGGTLVEAAEIGNGAAGVAVVQPGVVTVTREEVTDALFGEHGPAKVHTLDELEAIVAGLREDDKRVVWTNGCFDILHTGHIIYLQKARALGDALVVGINSDASVKAVKGPDRPIIDEAGRALVLSALECVDYVVVFGEPTTVPVLERLKPSVYAKGGDYDMDTINQEERHVIEGYGGEIAIIPGVEGQSTTNIIERISK
jgi:D-beta-D-heptose 7-phosphate kinase / D-beta-D-heptose 1-phosphate adenosyltransferase